MRYSPRCRLSAINFRCDLSSPFKRATLLFRVVSISLAIAMVTIVIRAVRSAPGVRRIGGLRLLHVPNRCCVAKFASRADTVVLILSFTLIYRPSSRDFQPLRSLELLRFTPGPLG